MQDADEDEIIIATETNKKKNQPINTTKIIKKDNKI